MTGAQAEARVRLIRQLTAALGDLDVAVDRVNELCGALRRRPGDFGLTPLEVLDPLAAASWLAETRDMLAVVLLEGGLSE